MERKFYCAKKEGFDALSRDTLSKVVSASGVCTDGLAEFSRFEIFGLSDDGFQKCKGLFFDGFSTDVYESVDTSDANVFVYECDNAQNERYERAVKIATGEDVTVKCAKIVMVYGVNKNDEDALKSALDVRFNRAETNYDNKSIEEEIKRLFFGKVDNNVDFLDNLFDENVAKISSDNIKFSKKIEENKEVFRKTAIEKETDGGEKLTLKTFSGSAESAVLKAYSKGYVPVSAVVTSYFSKDNRSCFSALENAKRTSEFLEKANISASHESFVTNGFVGAGQSVAVAGVKKLDFADVKKGDAVLLLSADVFGAPETLFKLKRVFENEDAKGIISFVDNLQNVLNIGVDIDLKKVEFESAKRMLENSLFVVTGNAKSLIKILRAENICAVEIGSVNNAETTIKIKGKTVFKNTILCEKTNENTEISEKTIKYDIKPVDKITAGLIKADRQREGVLYELTKPNVAGKAGLDDTFDGKSTAFDNVGGKYRLTKENVTVTKVKDGVGAVIVSASGECDFSGGFDAQITALSSLVASGAEADKTTSIFVETDDFEKAKLALLGAMTVARNLGVSVSDVEIVSEKTNVITVTATAFSSMKAVVGATFSKKGRLLRIPLKTAGVWDFDKISGYFDIVQKLAKQGALDSATVVKDGGVVVSAIKSSIGNGMGLYMTGLVDEASFQNDFGDILILEKGESGFGKFLTEVGEVTDVPKFIINDASLRADAVTKAYSSTFEKSFPTETYCEGFTKNLGISFTKKKVCGFQVSRPKVFMPVFDTTYDAEAIRRFKVAGARTETLILKDTDEKDFTKNAEEFAKTLKNCQILLLSDGNLLMDALFTLDEIKRAVEELLSRDGLILGVAQGFNTLLKTGLLPYGKFVDDKFIKASLIDNIGAKKTCGIRRIRVTSNLSPWFNGVKTGDIFKAQIAEESGRFVADKALMDALIVKGQIAGQYVDLNDNATVETLFNPCGSANAVDGIFSPDGRIYGRVTRFSRVSDTLYQNSAGEWDAKIFESGVKYFK